MCRPVNLNTSVSSDYSQFPVDINNIGEESELQLPLLNQPQGNDRQMVSINELFDRASNIARVRAEIAEKSVGTHTTDVYHTGAGGIGDFEVMEKGDNVVHQFAVKNGKGEFLHTGSISDVDALMIDEDLYVADKSLEKLNAAIHGKVKNKALLKLFTAAHKDQLSLAATIRRVNGANDAGKLDGMLMRTLKRVNTLEHIMQILSGKSSKAKKDMMGQLGGTKDVAKFLDDNFDGRLSESRATMQKTLREINPEAYGHLTELMSGRFPPSDKPVRDQLKALDAELKGYQLLIENQFKGVALATGKGGKVSMKDERQTIAYDFYVTIADVRTRLKSQLALCNMVFAPPELGELKSENCQAARALLSALAEKARTAIVRGGKAWDETMQGAKDCVKQLKAMSDAIMIDVAYSKLSEDAKARIQTFMQKTVPQFTHFVAMLQQRPQVSIEDAQKIMRGDYNVNDYVKTLAMGLKPSDMVKLDTLTEAQPLGQGASSTTFLCQDANGKKCVFKPELTSFYGVKYGIIGQAREEADQFASGTAVCMATKDIANAAGIGHVIVNTHVGHVNGQYGMVMEYSRGVSLKDLLNQMDPKDGNLPDAEKIRFGEGGATLKDINALDAKEKRALMKEIARQMNQLQWLDLLTGQLDRHGDNYRLYISPDCKTVEVKGIDNDSAFSDKITKIGEYPLDQVQKKKFLKAVRDEVGPDRFEAELQKSGINPDDQPLVVTFNKLTPRAKMNFIATTGFNNPGVPSVMDVKIKEMVKHFTKNIDSPLEYKQLLRERHLSEVQIEAAVKRLKDARALIDSGEMPILSSVKDKAVENAEINSQKKYDRTDIRYDMTDARISRYVENDYFMQGAMRLLFQSGNPAPAGDVIIKDNNIVNSEIAEEQLPIHPDNDFPVDDEIIEDNNGVPDKDFPVDDEIVGDNNVVPDKGFPVDDEIIGDNNGVPDKDFPVDDERIESEGVERQEDPDVNPYKKSSSGKAEFASFMRDANDVPSQQNGIYINGNNVDVDFVTPGGEEVNDVPNEEDDANPYGEEMNEGNRSDLIQPDAPKGEVATNPVVENNPYINADGDEDDENPYDVAGTEEKKIDDADEMVENYESLEKAPDELNDDDNPFALMKNRNWV